MHSEAGRISPDRILGLLDPVHELREAEIVGNSVYTAITVVFRQIEIQSDLYGSSAHCELTVPLTAECCAGVKDPVDRRHMSHLSHLSPFPSQNTSVVVNFNAAALHVTLFVIFHPGTINEQ